jgi:aspartyl-tRNA(Asn)/glutamyl-tRNA(Gln) amidotransferase subunit B
MDYQTTIGLEIHVELKTASKMFCSCKNDPDEKEPNLNICPVCLGHPGTLPVANITAIKSLLKTALALNCQIALETFFERKNYFYPDLPKGYQISQYLLPLSEKGYLLLFPGEKREKKIRITRIHLEEDTGKLIHPEGKDYSLVDFNRAGVPLMELVTEPDIHSAEEVREFAQELQLILRYLDVSGANMEKGEMRCEVNLSLNKKGAKTLGRKVELKNLNSLRAAEKAVAYEIERQKKKLEAGERVEQETRGWDEFKEITFSQRVKEEAHDYRYFPEPDLPPLSLSKELIKEIEGNIPELPQDKRKRLKEEYSLDNKYLAVLIANSDLGEYFEKTTSELRVWVKEKKNKLQITDEEFKKISKLAANYLLTDVQGLLKGKSFREKDFSVSPENFAEFVSMIYHGEISSRIAKIVLEEMFKTGGDPSQIIKSKNLGLIKDESELEPIIKKIVKENPQALNDYNKGKKNAFKFLIGQIMAETKGKADPKKINELLKDFLK